MEAQKELYKWRANRISLGAQRFDSWGLKSRVQVKLLLLHFITVLIYEISCIDLVGEIGSCDTTVATTQSCT